MSAMVRKIVVRFPRPEDRDAFLRQVRSMSAAELGVLSLKPGFLVEVWATGGQARDALRRLIARDHGSILSQS